jgi:hypothetical protein
MCGIISAWVPSSIAESEPTQGSFMAGPLEEFCREPQLVNRIALLRSKNPRSNQLSSLMCVSKFSFRKHKSLPSANFWSCNILKAWYKDIQSILINIK